MWKTVKLGDVCDFQGGSQPPKKEFVYEEQKGYVRFIQIRDFKSDKNLTYIPVSNKNRLCSRDDIFIGRYGASVGQILKGLKGAYNVALMKTIPNEEFISKGWLFAYLNSSLFQKPLKEVSSRSAQNGFSKDDISSFELPLPPLPEQERIVAKLDAAFAEVDKAVEGLSNKLISCESLLVKSISDEFAVPKAEHNIKFADVCELKRGYDLPKRQRKSGNFPLFSANGITDYVYESKVVAPGVVTGRSGTIGAVHYTDEDFWPLNTALYVRDFKGNLPRYIFYFLKSFNLKSFSSGAGVPTLNRNVLSAELVNINRKKEEQQRAINKLDSVINKIEKLKITFKEQENNYIALKSAILSQELQSSEAA